MEKVYKTMNSAGKFNLVVGIFLTIVCVLGCICGAFMIAHGARLFDRKKDILF